MTAVATHEKALPNTRSGAVGFRRFRGREGLAAIKSEWEHITRLHGHPAVCQRYEWYLSYLEALEPEDGRMNFIVAYRDGEPCAVYPLRFQAATLFGLNVQILTLPQHPHLPLGDFLHQRSEDNRGLLLLLIEYLRTQRDICWDLICVPNALDGSAADFAIQEIPSSRRYSREQKRCFYVRCDDTYTEIRKRFSKKVRANLNTHHNRLAREGSAEFRFVRDGEELPGALSEFLALEGSGWKGHAGEASAINLNPTLIQFYQSLARHFGAAGDCEIKILRLNGRPIAGAFHLRSACRDYTVKIGYDETKHTLSPGSLLLDAGLRRLSEDAEIDVMDFMSESPWYLSWGAQSATIWRHLIANHTVRGLAIISIHRVRAFARPAVTKLRDLFNAVGSTVHARISSA